MIEAWIPVTLAAAFFQNLRSAVQKHLKGSVGTLGSAYARFVFALPLSAAYLLAVHHLGAERVPDLHARFLLYCLLGGVCQILFTVFLLWLFSFRSFAVGTTFSKLEVVMVAALGALILGDQLNGFATAAIALSAAGVLALTMGQSGLGTGDLAAGLLSRPTAIGLASAAWLGASVVFFRGAALSLDHPGVVYPAAVTLFVSLTMQTLIMGAWLLISDRDELYRVFRHWRWTGLVGIAGALASIGWFTAFTMQNASYVRALGQVELVFTFFATTRVFREPVSGKELAGIFMVVSAILLILLAA